MLVLEQKQDRPPVGSNRCADRLGARGAIGLWDGAPMCPRGPAMRIFTRRIGILALSRSVDQVSELAECQAMMQGLGYRWCLLGEHVLHHYGRTRTMPERRIDAGRRGGFRKDLGQGSETTGTLVGTGVSPTRPSGGNPLPPRPLGHLPTPGVTGDLHPGCPAHPGRHGDADLQLMMAWGPLGDTPVGRQSFAATTSRAPADARRHRRPRPRVPCGHPGRHGDADLRLMTYR
jgi:hypothetical protein